ncbi:MAG: SDR family NAD(P)-dependent oxidoreductase [Roseiflexaceae bacterium]|nr:SDR family NAD(P)-dependent oxidoreductase [Roseiflexaceae bacterium]
MNSTQTVIVTGGNTGLGYACVRELASAHADWSVVIASRNQQASQVAQQAAAETGNTNIRAMPLDLASLASVRAFASELATSDLPPLYGLVCNAGIQIVSGTSYTAVVFETCFGVNHLGHFLLINLLLPQMRQPGRIVIVGSGTHDPADPIAKMIGGYAPRFRDAAELAFPERFPDPAERGESTVLTGRHRYGTSKLCNLLCGYELDRRLKAADISITVNMFDPGLMPGTNLAREADAFTRFAWNRLLPLLGDRAPGISRVATSGRNLARLIDAPAFADLSGAYIAGQRPIASSAESRDLSKARQLWQGSAELVGLGANQTGLRGEPRGIDKERVTITG